MRTEFWLERPKQRDKLEDAAVNASIILKWMLGKIAKGRD
jgi:hypothetical protein